MSTLERLGELCPPPVVRQPRAGWARVEAALGTPLPDDCKQLTRDLLEGGAEPRSPRAPKSASPEVREP